MFWFLNNREYIDILYNRVKKRRMKRLLTCHKYEQSRHHQVLSYLVGWTTLDPSHIRPSWLRYPPIYVEKIRCNKPRAKPSIQLEWTIERPSVRMSQSQRDREKEESFRAIVTRIQEARRRQSQLKTVASALGSDRWKIDKLEWLLIIIASLLDRARRSR